MKPLSVELHDNTEALQTGAMTKSSDSVRVLLLGDSNVGKTCVLNLLCRGKIATGRESRTIGCMAEVLIHAYKERKYFVELLEVGGSQKFAISRKLFYTNYDGLILVHDLNNKKSYHNLRKWIKEAIGHSEYQWNDEPPSYSSGEHTLELRFENEIVPVLFFGTNSDLLSGDVLLHQNWYERGTVALSTLSKHAFADNSAARVALNRFFDRVIYRRYHAPKKAPQESSSHLRIDMRRLVGNRYPFSSEVSGAQ